MFSVSFATIAAVVMLLPLGSLAQGRNSIEGRITGPGNTSVENVLVFLLTDTYGQLGRTSTDGSGRYQFRNLPAANYYVEVEPTGTGYERQRQRIEVNPYDPSGRGGAEIFRLDFALKPDKFAKPGTGAEAALGSIFVQDIPPAAKEAYQQGAERLKKGDLKMAEVGLTHAIEIFLNQVSVE